ncbi:SDR family oxidoreductase [Frankia sp. CiP1_Cm_nod2]|uniref:SDR family oxidoreductase n=1 Tax=Frankia sp. CiP1_Cm_nod2 TaxID=2897161 RepID=UPI0020254E03
MADFLNELFSLRRRTAVVTGATSGIGRGIALGRAGARVVAMGRRADALESVVDDLRVAGGLAEGVRCDVASRAELSRAADLAAEPFGEPDILVASAGVNIRPPFGTLTDDEWDLTMAVNLDAPFLLGRRYGPLMAERGWGRIINLASQQTVRAFGNSGAYGVSKAAVAALTRSQAEAWSRHGVCCNAIAPGFVRTPLTRSVFDDPERATAMAARTMVGRNGELSDLVGAAVFLAGPAAAYITGQTIFVDGGFSST